jgi:hypothetical protein
MTVPDVVALMSDYTSFFRRAPPVDGDDATMRSSSSSSRA